MNSKPFALALICLFAANISLAHADTPKEITASLVLNDGVTRENPVVFKFEKTDDENVYHYVKAFWGPEEKWFGRGDLEEFEGNELSYNYVLKVNIKSLEAFHDSAWLPYMNKTVGRRTVGHLNNLGNGQFSITLTVPNTVRGNLLKFSIFDGE